MLSKRVLVVVVLLPIGLLLIYLGGFYFAALITLGMVLGCWEYDRLMRQAGHQPATVPMLLGVGLLCATRAWNGFEYGALLLSFLVLALMTSHLFAYERGRDQAATDFAISVAGVIYLGWIGAYLISLRDLPYGASWLLLSLFSVWFADSGAYFIGRQWGRRRLSPRLSPKKSWEGYWAGVFFGTLCGVVMGWGISIWQGSETGITPLAGLVLGIMLSTIPTLGDLGESMIKRQAGVKDSGSLLPGHGGVFDRIDSWLWAGVIAYYVITVFFI